LRPSVGIHASAKGGEWLTDLVNHAATVDLATGDPAASGLQALVLLIDEHEEASFHELRQLKNDFPKTPIVVVAKSLSANMAVELVKLGIADCMCIPAPPGTLWRKLERTILHSGGPAIDSTLLTLLWDANAYPAHQEKRRCFRSATVADYPSYMTVVSPTMLPRMVVRDLSILTEGCPGGFALIGGSVHSHVLKPKVVFRFILEVPEFNKPIPGHGNVMRVLSDPTPTDPHAVIGAEYRLDDPAHQAPVRRFWSESQRRVAAVARSAATLRK
jgi:hypothetical protein